MAEDKNNGWIESIDPTTGRTFYANRYTRTTQWDPPPGWRNNNNPAPSHHSRHSSSSNGGTTADNSLMSDIAQARLQMESMGNIGLDNGGGANNNQDAINALPDGWEEMTDPTTGRKFYIDHATKSTTWERPTVSSINNSSSNNSSGGSSSGRNIGGGNDNNFSRQSMMKLNQYGSHTHWDEDPHVGSRTSHSNNHNGYNNNKQHHNCTTMSMGTDTSHQGPPPLDFVVVSVPDAMRMDCPGCSSTFTYTKRRHHCRLCGDVFCDACSSSRTILPLDGPEFATPVRVCDWCMKDVKKGNYFSLRRYLTPLQLYDPDNKTGGSNKKDGTKWKGSLLLDDGGSSGEDTKEITANTVAASLSSLSADIDAMVNEPTTFREKITIPAGVLVSAVGKHLKERTTAEYAIRVLASLLMLGNVVGDDSFALAIYEGEGSIGLKRSLESSNSIISLSSEDGSVMDKKKNKRKPECEIVKDVLTILEWNGHDERSLSALEQAAKVIYYITEPNFVAGVISRYDSNNKEGGGGGPVDIDAVGETMHDIIQIDIHRAFRSMLDHATSLASPSLQRWAAATLRHLINEDQRRACVYSSGPNKYDSFMNQLVSTGGVMILCSLLSSEDAETRTHATSTLEAIVIATREIGLALNTSSSSMGGFSRVGRGTPDDSRIVDAIVSNGGCGPALAHLLISADESVAMMGCSLASSLISPLLTDPRGSGQALQQCISRTGGGTGLDAKDDGLSSYREAALALVVGDGSGNSSGDVSCLPSLIQILRSGIEESSWGNTSRSIKLQVAAGECLAAISLAIGHIVGDASTENSTYDSLYMRAKHALEIMEQERIFDVAYRLVTSASSHSLNASRDTPQARLREAAGLTLLALSSCSSVSATYLTSNKAVSNLLNIAAESMDAPSTLRGEWASRGLCYLETSAMLLLRAWKNDDTSCLNLLLDALDAGIVGLASRLVKAKVHLKHHDKAYSQMRIKMAVCYILASMFGMARLDDKKDLGLSRLYSAVDADCAAALAYGNSETQGRTDLVASTVYLLGATLPYAHRFANERIDEPLPMMDLSEACLLAVGSMCGAATATSVSVIGESKQDKFSHLVQDASSMACRALTSVNNERGGALLPSVLIGALGETLVVPSLRLTLAIAQNHPELRGELARCGMIVPVGDILQHSLSSGERYTFSVVIAIVRFCGPFCSVESSNSGSIVSLQNAIRTLACVLMISEGGEDSMGDTRRKKLQSLKFESLLALEALSSNEALHSTMAGDAFPALTAFLTKVDDCETDSSTETESDDMVCSALRTVQKIIAAPSSTSSAAVEGMVSALVATINRSYNNSVNLAENRKLEVSLDLLHSITLGKSDVVGNGRLLSSGVLESVASLVGPSSKLSLLALELVEFIIADMEASQLNSPSRESMMQQFIEGMAGQTKFLRTLFATMLALRAQNHKLSSPPLYGNPLTLPGDDQNFLEVKVLRTLFNITSILCSNSTGVDDFSQAFMLRDVRGSDETVAFAASIFLQMLMDESNGVCVPQNHHERTFYVNSKLPLVRSHLLEALNRSLDECMSSIGSRDHAKQLLFDFKLPQLCLMLCQSKTVSQAAFDLFENIVLPLPVETIGSLLLTERSSLVALFDLVIGQNNMVPDFDHAKQTFALTLGNLAKAGLLREAVEHLSVRNNAIAALCAAMQGSDEHIDENEDSLPRICVECLAAILCVDGPDGSDIAPLEAKTMATAVGQILSKTVLGRFFTQASLETTFDDSMDHSSDRAAISQSAEARLLCSMASFPDTLEVLRKVGGLEAIGLIAHEGELNAIQAVQKACELNPMSVVQVDCHLSIMDALTQVENKLSNNPPDIAQLREVVIRCMQIINSLCQNKSTKSAVMSSDQSSDCARVATHVISASCRHLIPKTEVEHVTSVQRTAPKNQGQTSSGNNNIETNQNTDEGLLEIGDSVVVDSSQSSPSKKSQPHDTEQLEGVIAHLGHVQFAPGDEWVGIRLTGPSVGKGKNDGSVKGVRYFECGSDKNGMFVKRSSVKKKACDTENESAKEATVYENTDAQTEMVTEGSIDTVDVQREELWALLLTQDDFTLEKEALSMLLNFSSSKSHRDLLMGVDNALVKDLSNVIKLQSPELTNFQCSALDLLVSFTFHLLTADSGLTSLLCLVIDSRSRSLQISRDKQEILGSKHLLVLALAGLQNMLNAFLDGDERSRAFDITTDLFIFLSDSFYKGSKSRRMTASVKDGLLFYHLSSIFMLALGSESSSGPILSTRFVSSLIRFIMMTAGLASFDRSIPITEKEEGEYWRGALCNCLHCLSCMMSESSQGRLGISFASLIGDVEGSTKSFLFCLQKVSEKKFGDSSSVSAKHIMTKLDRLSE